MITVSNALVSALELRNNSASTFVFHFLFFKSSPQTDRSIHVSTSRKKEVGEGVTKLEQIREGALVLWLHGHVSQRCIYGEILDIII